MSEGHSFNLCNNVILLAYSWAYDKFIQGINRVHRINSLKPVNVYSIICDGSIDRKLENMIQEKGDTCELVLDGQLLGEAETFRQGRLLQAWFRDPADQAFVAGSGFDGAVRADPGDYVYPVDSNVAPTSKLSAMTTRSLDLRVQGDAVGNARNTLAVAWQNRIQTADGAPYRALPMVGKALILGMYFRLMVPERSRVEGVSGGSYARLSNPAVVEVEAGRTAIGTYLRVPPGRTGLTYTWTSPYAADADETGGTYRLTIQKQPGLLPGPLTLTIRVPAGFHITDANPELTVRGDTATLAATFERDVVVEVTYAPASGLFP
jgi:hypothetical protein